MAITGLDNVLANLTKEVRKIEGRTAEGLLAAAKHVQAESQEIVPHDKGVLINTAFSDVDRQALIARVGYTAGYAPIVHEMPTTFNYSKPGTGPKFLERPIKSSFSQILQIIAKRAKID